MQLQSHHNINQAQKNPKQRAQARTKQSDTTHRKPRAGPHSIQSKYSIPANVTGGKSADDEKTTEVDDGQGHEESGGDANISEELCETNGGGACKKAGLDNRAGEEVGKGEDEKQEGEVVKAAHVVGMELLEEGEGVRRVRGTWGVEMLEGGATWKGSVCEKGRARDGEGWIDVDIDVDVVIVIVIVIVVVVAVAVKRVVVVVMGMRVGWGGDGGGKGWGSRGDCSGHREWEETGFSSGRVGHVGRWMDGGGRWELKTGGERERRLGMERVDARD